MGSELTKNQQNPSEKPSTQISLQISETGLESFSTTSEDQTIQKKVNLQLSLHFQRMLQKSEDHYGEESSFFGKKVSTQKNANEAIEYFKYFKYKIKALPPQHHQQLLLLIDYFDNDNQLITNCYCIDSDYQNSTGPAKFSLRFNRIKKRIDLEQFLSFNNWNHLRELSFYGCGWFNDDDWRALVEHAENFKNLNMLWLSQNIITAIKEGDIDQFKSLELIDLRNLLIKTKEFNPLCGKSKEVLGRLKLKNKKMRIGFDE